MKAALVVALAALGVAGCDRARALLDETWEWPSSSPPKTPAAETLEKMQAEACDSSWVGFMHYVDKDKLIDSTAADAARDLESQGNRVGAAYARQNAAEVVEAALKDWRDDIASKKGNICRWELVESTTTTTVVVRRPSGKKAELVFEEKQKGNWRLVRYRSL